MVSSSALLLASAISASALAYPESHLAARQSACAGTHIFLAPGNNEILPGRQANLVNVICEGNDSCDWEGIEYAHMAGDEYCGSVTQGAANGQAQIAAYNQRCPDSNIVVSGYSQGAHVVGDIIGGGGGTFFNNCVQKANAGIDPNSAAGRKIAAVLTVGDTRHTAFQPYNVLTGAGKNGIFPRPANQLAGLNAYASVYHDYCVSTDPVCAGGDVIETHLNYFDIYSGEAGAFVKSLLAAGPRPTVPSVSSSTSALVSVSTSIPVNSNGSVALYPTYTLAPTTIPLVTYVPATMTSTMDNGDVTMATLIPEASKYTDVPAIPSPTSGAVVTVSEVEAPADVLTSVTYTVKPSGAASGSGVGPSASAYPTNISANGGMSVSVGSGSAVVALMVGAFMAMM